MQDHRRIPKVIGCLYAAALACCGSGREAAPVAAAETAGHSAASSASPGNRPASADAQAGDPGEPAASSSAASSGQSTAASEAQPSSVTGGCSDFTSSFDALQKLVIERRGCTASNCHGDAKVGGLDLRADASYQNLVSTSASGSKLMRVTPGDPAQSYLYLKLQAATEPGTVQVAGSPMPIGTKPLSTGELHAVGLWIQKGAPQQGVVVNDAGKDVTSFLELCQNQTGEAQPGVDKPLEDTPLEPPPPDKGVQIVFPQYVLESHTETETCTPFAYDLTDQVPAGYSR